MTAVVQAYRFALDPTHAQERALMSHAGAARVAHNWALALIKANLDQRAAERTYGLTDDELTPAVPWSLYALRRLWNCAKAEVAPWWRDNSKEAYNTGLDTLARGLGAWLDSRSGKRRGRPVGFPRFASRHRSAPAVRFTTGAFGLGPDRQHVKLPRIGLVRAHESTRKLARRVNAGTARILAATVRRTGGRWFCSFTVEVQRADAPARRPGEAVGVDLGIKHLAVLSTGEVVPNPRHLGVALRQLGRRNRTLARRQGPHDSATRTRREPSNRWRRARRAVAAAHTRVANQRRDGLHKLTSSLAAEFGTVVVEDLHVLGMLANRRLARHVADAAFAQLRRQLDYKCQWRGGRLIVADRWFASSKTCSGCGTVKAKLALSERTYVCSACGLVLDRDVNAARNLAALAGQYDVAGSGSETQTGREADQKSCFGRQAAVKRQPGTAVAGQTGTGQPQGWPADRVLAREH